MRCIFMFVRSCVNAHTSNFECAHDTVTRVTLQNGHAALESNPPAHLSRAAGDAERLVCGILDKELGGKGRGRLAVHVGDGA